MTTLLFVVGSKGRSFRRHPIGAEVDSTGVAFRVWSPGRRKVEVAMVDGPRVPLTDDGGGYWTAHVPGVAAGARYGFILDDGERFLPDPASRFQPDGPHGPSEVVDATSYGWSDSQWRGVSLSGQAIYELHIGTFSTAGTWEGARAKLYELRDVGVTLVEVMPVADFVGTFGWGYDGVNLFAPTRLYGRPNDFRAFVDEAHRLGLGVILDVVYNHLGPDGNYLTAFSPSYFSSHGTEWGAAINFDGVDSEPVRELYRENAACWIEEYHLDGLRLDATQSIVETSSEHVLAQIGRRAREAAGHRDIIIIAENEPQETRLVRSLKEGGYGLDALWNDDFHHSAVVALTGHNEAYYSCHLGTAQELLSAIKYGYLYQGQHYHWQKNRRGTSTRGLSASAFVSFLENHDQVSNSCGGERIWQLTSPGQHRAMTALLGLGPWTPMLFQGQEWNTSSRFQYFADYDGELADGVRRGRTEFLAQFPSCGIVALKVATSDPCARKTFEDCRLDWTERERPSHARVLALHRDLFALRRSDPVLRAQGGDGVRIDGAVLSAQCLLIRFFAPDPIEDRLLVVNLGTDLDLAPGPEPLLAPTTDMCWDPVFSSEEPRYGGGGAPHPEADNGRWHLKGRTTTLLRLVARPG